MRIKFDSLLLSSTLLYLTFGFLIFFSASLGLMARNEDKFFAVLNNQFFYGIVLGLIAFTAGILIPHTFWKKLAYPILFIAVVFCILVFVPGIGFYFNGSYRWIHIGGFSFQPSEVLKYASILALASYYSYFYHKVNEFKYRILPVALLSLCAALVVVEPDLGTSSIIFSGIFGVFILLAARLKDILYGVLILLILLTGFYLYYPHAKERIATFMNPSEDLLGKSYQLNQAKIAIGSGGALGFGYAQGAQKYYHLPEPIGDSVFAVMGEEFGFIGSLVMLLSILFITFRLLYISYLSKDIFVKGVLGGMSIVLLAQTFLNVGSISGAIPLTGVPLPLISHGSTSLILILGMLGICVQMAGSTLKYEV